MKNASKIKVDLINDVSGLSYDPETINYLKKTKKPFVIHHLKGTQKKTQIKHSVGQGGRKNKKTKTETNNGSRPNEQTEALVKRDVINTTERGRARMR